jgi:hypothetical protein
MTPGGAADDRKYRYDSGTATTAAQPPEAAMTLGNAADHS